MFAGGRRRSSNVRVMQLFHELKQQFPTVPDHVVSACIASKTGDLIRDALLVEQSLSMGRQAQPAAAATTTTPTMDSECDSSVSSGEQQQTVGAFYSKKSDSVSVQAGETTPTPDDGVVGNSQFFVKRPTYLDIGGAKRERAIRPSEKCNDVHKLLNSDNVNQKPPRSPLTAKRLTKASPGSPLADTRRTTPPTSPLKDPPPVRRETPTQTTDTLIGGEVNLSLNVNCSVVQSPTRPRRSSVLQLTPQQPWMQEPPVSPRSYTSVNLTLRPPTSEPQAPIDITSQNSSLTYSTSTFDPQKGLQSRLQITVGPGGGSVSSVRTRPRSSYFPEDGDGKEVVPARTGSLPDLADSNEPPVVIRQQARIERLRIELKTEKAKLVILKREIAELEEQNVAVVKRADEELEKQLQREILHLQGQCKRLTSECDRNERLLPNSNDLNEDFYRNIYPGQRGPLTADPPNRPNNSTVVRGRLQYQGPAVLPQPDPEGPKWNCHMCTFQNHPLLDKCEQCEMPRILHGTNASTPSPAPPVRPPNFSFVRPVGQVGPFLPASFNGRAVYRQGYARNGGLSYGQGRTTNSGNVSHV